MIIFNAELKMMSGDPLSGNWYGNELNKVKKRKTSLALWKSASGKDVTNINDSLPQRNVCNALLYAPIYVVDALIYLGLTDWDTFLLRNL